MNGERSSLRLRIVPGAPRTGIVGPYGDGWKVSVAAAPEAGKANAAVLDLLARVLELPRRDLRLQRGKASRDKVVSFEGLTRAAAHDKLAAAAEGRR